MRVFVAGAAGAIGRPLLAQLAEAGHEVTGTTRNPRRASRIRAAGGIPVVLDVFDAAAVEEAVAAARPEVLVVQLTSLPERYDPRSIDYGPTNRVRVEGGANLLAAAAAAGVRRVITQSIAFLYAPEGDRVKDEEARPFTDAPEPFASAVAATLEGERIFLETEMEGVVLRYGWFYGPATYYAYDGNVADEVRRRRVPIVGDGSGVFSFVHVEDAAAATVAAAANGEPGVYNVCDDDPAPMRDWLPYFARTIGAKRPFRVPAWLARPVAGAFTITMATELHGASNAKAKRDLGWTPRYASWRQGFREALG
ncbi:MAG TPA: NAD(P)-dependent oxidoreductase [Solirubrobacterales bacterium]|nr:NAD(P)-dependent oxidoreductase [Solirubrobacterales bacterium]